MPMVNGLGKPAGVRCVQLLDDERCAIFGDPRRPAVCSSLMPSEEMCGRSRAQALSFLSQLERATAPCR
ncbi:MAG: YkgJ family cysteine cluster protein [Nevskia sp.]|nr:YkgJ family cysteine cluster protein [Nevskia sp.]